MDNVPDWRDGTLGTRVRVALWLASEVGEGGTFRKQQLRDAMPGVEQIDRRMRDLRPAGWEILTYRDRLGWSLTNCFSTGSGCRCGSPSTGRPASG